MSGDWLDKSKLTRRMRWTWPVRFPKLCKPVSSFLYTKGKRDQPVARMRFREPGRNAPLFYEAVCRFEDRPFRLQGSLKRGIEIVQGGQSIAWAAFESTHEVASPSPAWEGQVKCNILGAIAGESMKMYWLCSRSDFLIRTTYIVNNDGRAEMSWVYGSNAIHMVDAEVGPERSLLLALCWFISQIQGAEHD